MARYERREDGSKRRVTKNGTCWIRPEKRLAIYLRDCFTCLYCGRDLHDATPTELSLDHLTPQSQGGSHHESNLVTACFTCNSRRQDRPWTNFAPAGAHQRIRNAIRRTLNLALAKAIRAGQSPDPRTPRRSPR